MPNYSIVHETLSLREALARMDHDGSNFLAVVDLSGVLHGVMTDGDIRRHLLGNGSLEISVREAMNPSFYSLSDLASEDEVRSALVNYEFVPIVESGTGILREISTQRRIHQVPVLEPHLDERDLDSIIEVFKSGWVSSKGPKVSEFEREFEKYTQLSNAVAVSNGTVAIELALRAFGIGPGDEVIVPDLTFAATVNAVMNVGATPVLVDILEKNLALDPELTRRAISPKTKAIVLVHLYGQYGNSELFRDICDSKGITLIEDCAEALGTWYRKRHVGTLADAATFSFFANKIITTGEGGMVTFKDQEIRKRACKIRDHGQSTVTRYWHDEVGSNFRLTGLQAALGVSQIKKIHYLVHRKREVAALYQTEFSEKFGLMVLGEEVDVNSSFWLNVLRLDRQLVNQKTTQSLITGLLSRGIEARPLFIPLSLMPPFRKLTTVKRNEVHVADDMFSRSICLPSSTNLGNDLIFEIVKAVIEVLEETID